MNTTPNYGFKNKADIKLCAIDAIDRELHRIEQQTQCALAAKADKCALEKHLLECHNCHKPCCECDCYTKEEVDKLLADKANTQPSQAHVLKLAAGCIGKNSHYYKNSFDEVTVYGYIEKQNQEAFVAFEECAELPAGFRPMYELSVPTITNSTGNAGPGPCLVSISPDGKIKATGQGGVTFGYRLCFMATFLAVN